MEIRQPLTNEEFKKIYSKVPRLCVDLIIRRENKILLTKRTLPSWNGQWHLPGGTVYYRESINNAAIRIAMEELAISITVLAAIEYIEYFSEQKERGFGYSISIPLICEILNGEPKASDQGSSPTFFEKIPDNIVEEQRLFLKKMIP